MAWPATPLTTYVPNFTPAIAAADLNALQSGVNGIINGTYNLQALRVTTGAPGSVIVPAVPGTIQVEAQLASSGTPGTVVPWGVLPRDYVLLGWAQVSVTGVVTRGANIFAVTHPAPGNFVVQTHVAAAGITDGIALVTSSFFAGPRFVATQYLAFGGKASATILAYDIGGVPTDTPFNLAIFGG